MSFARNVYVVDDDSDMRSSLFYALTTLGYSVRPSSSGQAFLDDADGLSPGCVLLDIRMPGLDGLQVIEALGERIARLPVVVMTGHGDVAIAVKAMKLGASYFVEKPFEEEALLGIIERVLAKLEGNLDDMMRRADAIQRIALLTERENEVLLALLAGKTNKEMASEIGLSVRTIEMHRISMMQRLHAKTLPSALGLAYLAGMADTMSDPARDQELSASQLATRH